MKLVDLFRYWDVVAKVLEALARFAAGEDVPVFITIERLRITISMRRLP